MFYLQIFAAETAEMLTYHQTDIKTIYPKEGWIEQNPIEILNAVRNCIEIAVENLKELDIDPADIQTIGITNQRETVIVWDKFTGEPLYNAVGELFFLLLSILFYKNKSQKNIFFF